jgi:hypothetical protein
LTHQREVIQSHQRSLLTTESAACPQNAKKSGKNDDAGGPVLSGVGCLLDGSRRPLPPSKLGTKDSNLRPVG